MTLSEFAHRLELNGGADRAFGNWKMIDVHTIPDAWTEQDEIDFYCSNGKSVYLLRLRNRPVEKYTVVPTTDETGITYFIAELRITVIDNLFLLAVLERFPLHNRTPVSTEFDTPDLKQHYLLRHFPTLLKRWKGKQMRLYDLSLGGHRSISIKLSDNRYHHELPYLQLACIEPVSMKGRFDYDTSDLEVREEGQLFVVYDKQTDFELLCGKVEITERQLGL